MRSGSFENERLGPGSGRYASAVARRAADLPDNPALVVTNRDEDCSPAAFRALLDELSAGPDPELESAEADVALRALRVDGDHVGS
jgi:hypothetical protein